jgi:hypothetical protein
MKPDWRALALLAAIFALWEFAALAPGCDGGRPRPSELIPARPGGAFERSLAKGRAAEAVRAGRLTLLEGAAAFREADRRCGGGEEGDEERYCRLMIDWVRGPSFKPPVLPDLASLLEAELDELRREGLRLPFH